jgi:hypothetical protein
MEAKNLAIIIRDVSNQWEGLRSTLGVAIDFEGPHMFVIGELQIPEDRVAIYKESLEYLADVLEGKNYTDNKANLEKWDFFEYMSLDDMARKLPEYDLISPF